MRRWGTGLVLVAMVGLLCACGSSGSESSAKKAAAQKTITIGIPNFALPSPALGCGGASAGAGGTTSIPVTVSRAGAQVAAMANVCIDGQGPFPFVIDTGAAGSVIDSKLAANLHLAHVGTPQQFAGVGCTATSIGVQVPSWSVGGLSLSAQTVSAAALPDFGGPGQPDGLVGSDVWARFAAMRLDFARQILEVPGTEAPAPNSPVVVNGPSSTPVPPALLMGSARAVAPMRVEAVEGQVLISTTVRFAQHRRMQFVPDTGDSQSVIDRAAARPLGLAPSNVVAKQTTVCSFVTVPLVHSGPWSVGGNELAQQLMGSTNLGVVGAAGFVGLLGADQLSRFGSVIFDYQGGRLVLGAG